MKRQKGFVIPLLVTLIAILVLGGGVYLYEQNITTLKITIDNQPATSTPISEPKKTPSGVPVTPTAPANNPSHRNVSLYIGQNTSATASPGNKVTFSWDFPNAPSGSAVVIILDGPGAGRVMQDLSPSGSYTWTVPDMACSENGENCIGVTDSALYDYSTEGTYKVYAELYSPKGGLGGGMLPSSKDLKIISKTSSSGLVITRY